MGRSSNEQAQQNRARIVETASSLFRQHGVETVSVSDIMGALGLTNGGFYKHFDSKEALVKEAVGLAFGRSADSWRRVSKSHREDAALHARAIVDHYFRTKLADQTCPMIAFGPHAGAADTDQSSREAYRSGAKELFETFLDHSGHDAGLLFAAMVGAEFLAKSLGDVDWVKALRESVAEAVQSRP